MYNQRFALILICLQAVLSIPVINAQSAGNVLRFGVVTDVHYAGIPDKGNRTYSQSLIKLQAFVDTMNRLKPDFIIELGDFKDMDSLPIPAKTLVYLNRAEEVFSKFRGPRYHVLGNHDEDCIPKGKFLSLVENTGISKYKSYYSFDVKGFHCIVLDACFDSAGAGYNSGHYKWHDTNIPGEELSWLRSDLRETRSPALVFIHQRLDGSGQYFVKNASRVRHMLRHHHRVKAVFQGHYHEGGFGCINGIPYYTLKSLIEGNSKEGYNYALVEVDEAGNVNISGFGEVKPETLRCPGVL